MSKLFVAFFVVSLLFCTNTGTAKAEGKTIKKIDHGFEIVRFCIDGLEFVGWQSTNSTLVQVMGTNGKPKTCTQRK